jgi:ACS family glucarate transporter-like MFS transporter
MLRPVWPIRTSFIRWRMFAFLFAFGFLAFVQQKSLTVAAERMMPELGLSQLQIGWLESAFVLGYTVFQIPGCIFGQRFGARQTFVIIELAAMVAMIATPAAPALFSGRGLFVALMGAQLLLGVAQAAIFPMSAGVFEAWFPPRRWAFVQGLQTMGVQLGAAITPPLVTSLMLSFGWQRALYCTTLPALGLIAWWAVYARNTPSEHRSVSAQELTYIGTRNSSAAGSRIGAKQLIHVLVNRNVLLLALSYLCMNYVFYLLSNWVFLYLIQERHFSVLESGWLAGTPPLAAAIGAGAGGILTSVMCQHFGIRWGFRLIPVVALPVASLLLLAAVIAVNPYWAVLALAVCYASIELNEAAYWGSAMTVGLSYTMAVGGVLNTGGNLGGIIGIPIVAYLSEHHLWHAGFFIGMGLAVAGAAAWFGIDTERPVGAQLSSQSLN